MSFPKKATTADLFGPAIAIVDQAEADRYFEKMVAFALELDTESSQEEAEAQVKEGLGYYAGYFSHDVRAQVERLFNCVHPIFGSIELNGPPSPEAAFQLGLTMGREKMIATLPQPKNPVKKSFWERLNEESTHLPSEESSPPDSRPGRTR